MQNIRIQIRCLGFRQVSQLSAIVLQLIARCHVTLKSLDFDLIQGFAKILILSNMYIVGVECMKTTYCRARTAHIRRKVIVRL